MKFYNLFAKRGLACFLALVMCLSFLNLPVLADELHADQWTCGLEEHQHTGKCYEAPASAPELPVPAEPPVDSEIPGEGGDEADSDTNLKDETENPDQPDGDTTENPDGEENEDKPNDGTDGETSDETGDKSESESDSSSSNDNSDDVSGGDSDDVSDGDSDDASGGDSGDASGGDSDDVSGGNSDDVSDGNSDSGESVGTVTSVHYDPSPDADYSDGQAETPSGNETPSQDSGISAGNPEPPGSDSVDSDSDSTSSPNADAYCGIQEHTHSYECSKYGKEFVEGVGKLYEEVQKWSDEYQEVIALQAALEGDGEADPENVDLDAFAERCQELYAKGEEYIETATELMELLDLMFERVRAMPEVTDACDQLEEVFMTLNGEAVTLNLSKGTLTKSDLNGKTVTLDKNVVVNSTIELTKNSTLNLNGYTVTYTGTEGSIFHVTGGTFTLEGNGTISGGKGTKVKWTEIVERDTQNGEEAGGAVLVESGAAFTMKGGTITNNSAIWGGGIAVARGGNLNIYGGSITYNTATSSKNDTLPKAAAGRFGSGGGIFCAGIGEIYPRESDITITHNETGTVNDLGGGGIFVEAKGEMKIYNAVITQNTAHGQGGGVAGCLHGKMSNISPQTAAIYNNTANGSIVVTRLNDIDHSNWWQGKIGGYGNAKDYFCAGYSVIGSLSMNGGNAKWTGWQSTGAAKGVNGVSGDPIVVKGVVGLSAGSDNNVGFKADTFSGKTVTISDNTSFMHGGGIGCNGILSFGEKSFTYSTSVISLEASKTIAGVRDGSADSTKDGYTFQLLKNGEIIAASTSNHDGVITFEELSTAVLFGSGTNTGNMRTTLTLKELPGNKTGMTYDDVERTIIIDAKRTSEEISVGTGSGGLDITAYKVTDTLQSATVKKGDIQIENGASINGTTVTLNGDANFTNTMEYGGLQVKKLVEGPGDKDENFSIKVTLTAPAGKTADWDSVQVNGAANPNRNGGTITFSLKHDQTAAITGIPKDAGYEVAELNVPAGYQSVIADGEGTIIAGSTPTATVIVTNDRLTTNLTVKKVVEPAKNNDPSFAPDSQKVYTINVKLGSGSDKGPFSGNTIWDGYGTYIFNLTKDQEAVISGIPTLTSFEVSENTVTKIDNEEWTSNISQPQGVVNGQTVTVTNEYYKPQYTSIEVSKEFKTEHKDYKDEYKPTSVTVELVGGPDTLLDKDNKPVSRIAALNETNNWSASWNNLPKYPDKDNSAYVYSVKETAVTCSDGTFTPDSDNIIRVRGTEFVPESEISNILYGWNVDNGYTENGKVIVTNTWRPAENIGKATLEIVKRDKEFQTPIDGVTFELFDEHNESFGTATTENGGIATFSAMPVGTYILKEIAVPDKYKVDENLTEKNGSQQWTVTVSRTLIRVEAVDETPPTGVVGKNTWDYDVTHTGENPEGQLTVYNQMVKGSIKITKEVEGDNLDASHFSNQSFTFHLQGNGVNKTVSVKNGESVTVNDLRYGTYTITETATSATTKYYTWDGVKYSGDGIVDGKGFRVEVNEDGKTFAVVASNTYTRKLTELTVEKTVDYDAVTSNAPVDREFLIKVKLGGVNTPVKNEETEDGAFTGDTAWTKNGVYTFRLTAVMGEPGSAKITGIPCGTAYEITEVSLNKGWTSLIAVKSGIVAGQTATVQNHYFDVKKGAVSVTKEWADGEDFRPVIVSVQLYRSTGGTANMKTEAVGNPVNLTATNNWTAEWTDLPLYTGERGSRYTYTVKEVSVSYPAINDGYTADPREEGTNIIRVRSGVAAADGSGNEIVGGWMISESGNMTQAATNPNGYKNNITLRNTWIPARDLGETSFTIHKVDSMAATHTIAGAEFEMKGPGAYVNGVKALTGEDGTLTFAGLKDGDYILREIQTADGYRNDESNLGAWKISVRRDKLQKVETASGTHAGENTWTWTASNQSGHVGSMVISNEPIEGRISISKVLNLNGVHPGAEAFADETFTFAVYPTADVIGADTHTPAATLEVKADGEPVSTGLLRFGTYRIVETSHDLKDYQWTETVYEGAQTDEDGNVLVKISEQEQTYAVTAENRYTSKLGTLSITKTVSGEGGDTDRDWHFSVHLTPPPYTKLADSYRFKVGAAEGTLVLNSASGLYEGITLKHGQTAVIEGLPVGTTYVVTEQEADSDGYSTDINGSGMQITEAGQAVAVENVHCVQPQLIDITVNKVWANDGGINHPASVTVQLYQNGAAYGRAVTLSASNGWTHTWSGLDPDSTWTVDETGVPAGYTAAVTRSGNTFTVVNTYEVTIPDDPPPRGDTPDEPEPGPRPDPEPTPEPEPEPVPEPEIPEEETPLVDVPEEEVPLASIPEEEVPLAKMPEEEIEIPEEEVPLADIPATGDISNLWFGASLLSAVGLAILSLLGRKKRSQDEV